MSDVYLHFPGCPPIKGIGPAITEITADAEVVAARNLANKDNPEYKAQPRACRLCWQDFPDGELNLYDECVECVDAAEATSGF